MGKKLCGDQKFFISNSVQTKVFKAGEFIFSFSSLTPTIPLPRSRVTKTVRGVLESPSQFKTHTMSLATSATLLSVM